MPAATALAEIRPRQASWIVKKNYHKVYQWLIATHTCVIPKIRSQPSLAYMGQGVIGNIQMARSMELPPVCNRSIILAPGQDNSFDLMVRALYGDGSSVRLARFFSGLPEHADGLRDE
jgi:hypothetical protein